MSSAALFGGRVRADALETLALTSKPLTAYRVAKVIRAQPIQVLNVLKSLGPDVVRHSDEGWLLTSDSLRRFLRESSAQREAELRREKDGLLTQLAMRPRAKHRKSGVLSRDS